MRKKKPVRKNTVWSDRDSERPPGVKEKGRIKSVGIKMKNAVDRMIKMM